jgi:signal transduction histidine kinase
LTLHSFDNVKTIETSIISLQPIVEKAITQIDPLLRDKVITLKKDIHDGVLFGNADLLTELMAILLDNAVKYSPKATTITISSKIQKKDLIILIKDQGVGINREDIPYIFNRFYRADVSRSKINVDGYGLGLSIAKKIVDVHKGLITVQSTVNKGTTFTISLPSHS